jgi:hypothetical protein
VRRKMKKIVVYLTSEKIGLTISEKNANKENIEKELLKMLKDMECVWQEVNDFPNDCDNIFTISDEKLKLESNKND